jgi:hypothetical protein
VNVVCPVPCFGNERDLYVCVCAYVYARMDGARLGDKEHSRGYFPQSSTNWKNKERKGEIIVCFL